MKAVVYPGLVGLMAARSIQKRDVAKAAGMNPRTLYEKLIGTSDFTLSEANVIHATFFADVEKDVLFQRADELPVTTGRTNPTANVTVRSVQHSDAPSGS